jgi:large subunit ribosomal protein LX
MSMFEVKGKFKGTKIGKSWLPFTKMVESQSEKGAVEKVFSLIGSEHGLKRNLIKIDGVSAVE